MRIEKKRFFVLSLIGLLLMSQSLAQDIHFSQFYASPLNLNPSLSGVIDGNYRVAAIYRNQWSSISKDAPFVTAGGSFDMNIPFEKLRDIVGAGINLVNDKSGDGSLGMLHIALSLAYHKRLDKNGRHFIGWGIQPGFVQRSIFPNDLLFPSQFDGNTLNKDRPNGEHFSNTVIRYFDLNSGLLYSGKLSQRIGLMQGFSAYHLTRPRETFINDNNARLQNRLTVHGGLRIKATERIYFTPNYIYQYQNKAQEINLGSAVELHFNNGKQNAFVFSMGGWYRINDAAIASMTIEYKRMRLGASYDFNVSELKPATNLRGGFELTLIFTGVFIKQNVGPLLVPCPRL